MFQNYENKKQKCQINNRIQNNQKKLHSNKKFHWHKKTFFLWNYFSFAEWGGSGLWTHPDRARLLPVSPSGLVSVVLGWRGNTPPPPPPPPSSPSSSSTSGSRALTSQWALTSNPSTSTSSPTAVMSASVWLTRQPVLNSWRREKEEGREEVTPPVSSAAGKGLVTFPLLLRPAPALCL